MKRIIVITLLAFALTGCGNAPTNTTSIEPAANKPAAANISANSNSNTNAAPAAGVKVAAASDHKFGNEGIPKGWTWIDAEASTKGPVKYDTSGGTLKFTVPSGKDMFGENRTAPHMLQAIQGDFQIETRVKFDPKQDYQGAGLFIYKDAENYLRLERAFGGTGGSGSGIRLDARTKEDYKPITTPDQVETDARTVDLKIIRTGKKFIAFWRLNENAEWKEVGEFDSDYPDTVQVGIIACNTAATLPVEFFYIKLAPQV